LFKLSATQRRQVRADMVLLRCVIDGDQGCAMDQAQECWAEDGQGMRVLGSKVNRVQQK
jgi:hypothetical protein